MNKKLFTFFVLTFCFLGNMWVSAQTRWTAGEPVGGGEYYLYNLGANRYLNRGSSWDTHAIVDGAGLIVTSEAYNGGGALKTNVEGGTGRYLGLVGNGVWMNREIQRVDMTPVNYGGYTNACTLSCTVDGTTYYLGWAGGEGGDTGYLNNQVITITSYPTTEAFLWMLIKPDKRTDVANDYTFNIVNPDFERGNAGDYENNGWNNTDFNGGWTRGGFWKQKTYTTFTNAAYAEKWTANAPLGSDKIYQTVSSLPAGVYTLTVTAQAINQGNSGAPCTKGVRLYLGNSSTIIGAAGTYSVSTSLPNGGDLELGVEILSDNDANWVAFDNVRLYKTELVFSANSATVANGTTSYNGINLVGASGGGVSFTTECYGNISSATLDNNGHITNITYNTDVEDHKGGAVVVHATLNDVTATYVLTVAYKQHLWDFTNTYSSSKPHGDVLTIDPYPGILSHLRANNTDWAMVYKVRTYTGQDLTYLNGPVYSNASAIDGTNADYNEYTAGLLIQAEPRTFGSNTTFSNDYYSTVPGANRDAFEGIFKTDKYGELLTISPSEATGASGVTLYKGTKLTIPNLRIGQYVRVKWRRHAPEKGDKVLLTNLSDLKFTPMDYVLVNNNRMKRVGRGYHVFKVSSTGDVSFQVADEGWVNIYSIEVSDDFLDDNSWNDIVGDKAGTMDTELNFPSPNKLVYESGETQSWTTSGNDVFGQSNISLFYLLEGLERKGSSFSSTLSGTTIHNTVTTGNDSQPVFTSTFTPVGHGQLVAVAEGFTYRVSDDVFNAGDIQDNENIYWLDLQRTLITVNETGSTIQKYPYTWDFTRLAERTIYRLNQDTQYWSGNETDGYTPTADYQIAFTENTEITTEDDQWERDHNISTGEDYYGLAEYDGIGFNTNPEKGYSTSLTSIKVTADGTGLVVGDGSANSKSVTLNLPKVDAGYTVYVRVKENNNSSVTVGGESNLLFTDSGEGGTGEKVYTYTTTETGDVLVALKNAEVKKIAVSKMNKTCWLKDSNSKDGDTYDYYNTDSHDTPIDYSLTEYFTGNEIKAYTVTATGEDSKTNLVNSVTITPIAKAPAGYGYIVSTKYASDPNQASSSDASLYKRPLFTPSTLDQQMTTNEGRMETANGNFLKPHISAGSIASDIDPANTNSKNTDLNEDEFDFFVLTNKYYNIYDNQQQVSIAEVPGFYRLENISDALTKNRAFLALPKPESGPNVKFIPLFDFDGELVDAIDMISTTSSDSGIDVNGTFYTLQGMKIQGFPQKSGIYMQNGKKVLVK